MDRENKELGASSGTGSRERSHSAGSPPIGFDPSRGNLIRALETLLAKPNDMLAVTYATTMLRKAKEGCSVCGAQTVIQREDAPNFCPHHCPDHDYANEGGEWLCTTCGEHRPADWCAWEDTSITGDAA